jgi:hypothetical protein
MVRERFMLDCCTVLRCCYAWGRKRRDRGRSAKGMDKAKLVHRQMEQAAAWAGTDREATVGRKDNGEVDSVGGGDGS